MLGFIDNNVEEQGKFFKDLPIYPPEILEQNKPDFPDKNELKCSVTAGLIWFPWTIRQNYMSTKLNKAIVRGIRNTSNHDNV